MAGERVNPGDLAAMRAKIDAAREEEERLFQSEPDQPLDPEFVRSCLHNEERGDGILFSRLHRGKYIFVKNWGKAGRWFFGPDTIGKRTRRIWPITPSRR